MKDDVETVYELAKSASLARFRILRAEGEERSDRSWQRVTCHIHREDLPWGAIPIIYALAAISFGDADPEPPASEASPAGSRVDRCLSSLGSGTVDAEAKRPGVDLDRDLP